MRNIFTIIITAVILFCPSLGFTESKEIIAEGTYNMGDGETPTVAEGRALLQAKRIALEQAGTYVESYTKVKNLVLTEDEIKVMASGIMEVEILDKKRTIIGDGFNFWVKIKAIVNLDDIEKMAGKVQEKSVVEDYKKIQEDYAKSQKEIDELKKQLAQAKGEKEKKQVELKITDKERLFQANEWSEKGYKYAINGEYNKAIEALTSAIAMDPNYAYAYLYRGIAYENKGQQYDSAFEDYNRAIAIDPNYAYAYYSRGNIYAYSAKEDRAIEDYNKAIQLNPSLAVAYTARGRVYYYKKQYNIAIEDYNRAIALSPDDVQTAAAYEGRVTASFGLSVMEAIIKHKPLPPEVLKQQDRAMSDLQKACNLAKVYCGFLKSMQESLSEINRR